MLSTQTRIAIGLVFLGCGSNVVFLELLIKQNSGIGNLLTVINNYALGFNISMPLTLVFRAGSLMANMVLGVFVLNKTYTSLKYISVFMISVGIAICTIVSGQSISSENSEGGLTSWLIEKLNSKYGKHSNEAFFLYACHCLAWVSVPLL
ncbi:SLC35B4 [Lepeophtheirus salmonis]|uniref:SLC35B4 n=1 Tax=Lepeophtheirus salmonis TaxID=72036 RepID=A0A7R8CWT8_LEPSM|nr:SLC35B4 [Lepeophtheirus salmonis]CAF2955358.1 SLC35B4 [Lepeophtheirus salmonis]